MIEKSEKLPVRPLSVAITGATGFVGADVARACLNAGWSVRALVRRRSLVEELNGHPRMTSVRGDIRSSDAIRDLLVDADVVVHLAACLGEGSDLEFEATNVRAVGQLVQTSSGAGVKRFILVSSIEAYGLLEGPLTEAAETQEAGNAYSRSKCRGERLFWNEIRNTSLHARFVVEGVVIRPGMIYGPGSPFWTLRLFEQARSKRFDVIDCGEGNVFPVYIDDVVDGLIAACTSQNASGQVFNFVGPGDVRWRDWAKAYESIVGFDCMHELRDRSSLSSRAIEVMSRKASFSSEKAESLLGRKLIDFEEGMRRTEVWLRSIDPVKSDSNGFHCSSKDEDR